VAADPKKVAEARVLYEKFKPWISKYRGGLPGGFAAAIMAHESGGRMDSKGDPQLGEVGLYQIEASFPPKVGLPAEARYDAETNVFFGMLEYQLRAVEMKLAFPSLVSLGTPDSWKLARLAFAIGSGGTKKLLSLSRPTPGQAFASILAYVGTTAPPQLGSQSSEKVRNRVFAVQNQWDVGQAIAGSYGMPERIPGPKGLPYSVPLKVAPYLSKPITGTLLALGAIGLAGYFFLRRKDAREATPTAT
jgi:hypothetical protein